MAIYFESLNKNDNSLIWNSLTRETETDKTHIEWNRSNKRFGFAHFHFLVVFFFLHRFIRRCTYTICSYKNASYTFNSGSNRYIDTVQPESTTWCALAFCNERLLLLIIICSLLTLVIIQYRIFYVIFLLSFYTSPSYHTVEYYVYMYTYT